MPTSDQDAILAAIQALRDDARAGLDAVREDVRAQTKRLDDFLAAHSERQEKYQAMMSALEARGHTSADCPTTTRVLLVEQRMAASEGQLREAKGALRLTAAIVTLVGVGAAVWGLLKD